MTEIQGRKVAVVDESVGTGWRFYSSSSNGGGSPFVGNGLPERDTVPYVTLNS